MHDETIESLIKEKIKNNNSASNKTAYGRKNIETKVKDLVDFLEAKVRAHLEKDEPTNATTLIITHFNKSHENTLIYKIDIHPATKKSLDKPDLIVVKHQLQPDYYKVVCDGQNRISERILFGEFDVVFDLVHILFNKIKTDFKITDEQIPDNYVEGLLESPEILTKKIYEDMKMAKLTDLSLQQAVDLACLLMKIEIDFQKYTENIPTVGGLIKIATIDKEGFRFIKGNDLILPDSF